MQTLHRAPRGLFTVVLLLVACFAAASAENEPAGAGAAPLVGQLLVASPNIGDPQFFKTVILIVEQNQDGALGIIINRPVDKLSLSSLMAAIGRSDDKAKGEVKVFAGGPVQPDLGFVVHTPDYRRAQTLRIDDHLSLTSTPEVLQDIGHAHGPKRSLVAFGYTGWGPGQLEGEMVRGDWVTAPEDPDLVFDADRDKLWDMAWTRRTINL
jgi:putative transcriptional regulator